MPEHYESPRLTAFGTVETLTAALGNPAEGDYFYAHPNSSINQSQAGVGSSNTCESPTLDLSCPQVQ